MNCKLEKKSKKFKQAKPKTKTKKLQQNKTTTPNQNKPSELCLTVLTPYHGVHFIYERKRILRENKSKKSSARERTVTRRAKE